MSYNKELENIKAGAEQMTDSGYSIGTDEKYREFVKMRNGNHERINELFGQALDEAVPETWTTLNPAQLSKLKEKFAELIVKECCEVFIELRTRPADLAVKDVKKHFGIE